MKKKSIALTFELLYFIPVESIEARVSGWKVEEFRSASFTFRLRVLNIVSVLIGANSFSLLAYHQ